MPEINTGENSPERRELSSENLKAIVQWLKYLDALGDKIESDAPSLEQAVKAAYQANKPQIAQNERGEFEISRTIMQNIAEPVRQWRGKNFLEYKIKQQNEQFKNRVYLETIKNELQKLGLFSSNELIDLISFYLHDSNHLSADWNFGAVLYQKKSKKTDNSENPDILYFVAPERMAIFEDEINNFALLTKFSAFPQRFLKAIIVKRLLSLKKPAELPEDLKTLAQVQETTPNVAAEIAYPIALNIRRRGFGNMVLPIHINPKTQPEGDAIIIRHPERALSAEINPAILTSIIYNLVKNSQKALAQARDKHPEDKTPCQINIELSEHENGWNFVVTDTGTGIDTDKILQIVGTILKNLPPENQRQYEALMGEQVYQIMQSWVSQTDRLAARGLTLGQVWDFTKLPRLSGFGETSGFSSGTGLYGADYLVRDYRGQVVAANLHPSGAIFSVYLPKKPKVLAKAA